MKHEILLRIGPDDQCNRPAIGYIVEEIRQTTAHEEVDLGWLPLDDCEEMNTDGWFGPGPKHKTERGWFDYTKKRVGLPRKGLRWADADVRPLGWSDGYRCPDGIEIRWTISD
jgi:hypothetical protein